MDLSLAPDVIEPVLGYRAWLRAAPGSGVRLRSVFRPIYWPPDEPLRVECRRWGAQLAGWCDHGGLLPGESCECGIYGLRIDADGRPTWEGAAARLCQELVADPFASGYPDFPDDWVVGIVAGWGRVIVAERGWRAQFAKPVALFHPGSGSRVPRRAVEALAAEYGIIVIS